MGHFAAFLRGINVGGNKTIKMADLKRVFEGLGFQGVKTILASGNVIFKSDSSDARALERAIEQELNRQFTLHAGVIVRTLEELQKIYDSNPFAGIDVTSETRLYITFLDEKQRTNLKLPYDSDDKSFQILSSTGHEVFSVVDLAKGGHTVDLMKVLDKEFGKGVTTRSWNTLAKILT